MEEVENPTIAGLSDGKLSRSAKIPDNDSQEAMPDHLPKDPLQLLFFLAGTVAASEAARAAMDYQTAVALAGVRGLFHHPQYGPALAGLGFTSLEHVCRHLGIDKSHGYELIRNLQVLGETAYRRAEQAGLSRAEYRAVRGLPKGQFEEAKRILENEGEAPADKVKAAVGALLKAHGQEKDRADAAEQREKRAKTEQQKQKELATARLEELNRIRADKRLDYAAVNDIPVTTLAQETAAYVFKGMSLVNSLTRMGGLNADDKRSIRRLGGRVVQLHDQVMQAFTSAMGGLEGLAKPMVLSHKDEDGNWVPDEDEDGNWIPVGVTDRPLIGDLTGFAEPRKHPRAAPVAEPTSDSTDAGSATSTEGQSTDGDPSNV